MSAARQVLLSALLLGLVTGSACRRTAATALVPSPAGADSSASVVAAGASDAPLLTPPTPRARVPRDAARFEIDAVDDSTARFKPREASWIKPGMDAYIVDPFRRDALVARVRITSIWNETAIAVVTSQVTRVTNQQVVLMVPPNPSWSRRHRYFLGVVTGVLMGGTAGALLAR